MEDFLITTKDNPYNPYTEFDQWLNWDTLHGYNTLGRLDIYNASSTELSDEDEIRLYNEAVESLIFDQNYLNELILADDPKTDKDQLIWFVKFHKETGKP